MLTRSSSLTITAYRILILSCALIGAFAVQFARYDFLPPTEVIQAVTLDESLAAGAIGGALLFHLGWLFARPKERVSRAVAVFMAGNAVVWMLFLAVSPSLAPADFQQIEAERAKRDSSSGMDLVSHWPIVVAERLHGTYGSRNFADRLLLLSAGPAIGFAELVIVPSRYIGILATRTESCWIAGIGFLLSSAFWAAVGSVVSAIRKRRKRKRATPRSEIARVTS